MPLLPQPFGTNVTLAGFRRGDRFSRPNQDAESSLTLARVRMLAEVVKRDRSARPALREQLVRKSRRRERPSRKLARSAHPAGSASAPPTTKTRSQASRCALPSRRTPLYRDSCHGRIEADRVGGRMLFPEIAVLAGMLVPLGRNVRCGPGNPAPSRSSVHPAACRRSKVNASDRMGTSLALRQKPFQVVMSASFSRKSDTRKSP